MATPSPEFAQLARFLSQGQSRSAQPQQQQQESPFGPDATEESLLSQVGHTGLSALGIVGNFLDLPGSMVRDALVWDNPLDQLLNPFSSEGRNTGRDVLTKWGITDENKTGGIADWGSDYGEAAADIGGFATEMLLDPLGWMTGWGSKGVGASAKAAAARAAASPTKRAIGAFGSMLDKIDPGYHMGRAARGFGQQVKSPHRMGLVRKAAKALRTAKKTGQLPEGYTAEVAADHWNMVTGANAKMWAKSKKGRTEEQWFQKIDDIVSVDRDEFMAANLKQDRDILHQGNDVNSEAFKKWFGGSKVVDDAGEPLVAYHGTSRDFDAFEQGNVEGAFGSSIYFSDDAVDVNQNYARAEGPDVQTRVDREIDGIESLADFDELDILSAARRLKQTPELRRLIEAEDTEGLIDMYEPDIIEQMARETVLGNQQFRVLPVHLKMENPVYLDPSGKKGRTVFEVEYVYDDVGDIIGEKGSAVQLLKTMDEVALEFDAVDEVARFKESMLDDLADGEINASTLMDSFRGWDGHIEDLDTGDLANSEFMRTVFERMGFDGVVADAYHHFGPKRGFGGAKMPGMSGVKPGTFHYMVFDPTQIKSVNNRGTWDPNDPNILFQGDELRRDIAPAFYSKLNRVVDSKVSGKVGLQQLKATLKRSGVKDEEIEWAEIDGLFEGKKSATKDELKGWLKDHATELEETWRGHATEAETREFEAQIKDARHVQARKEKAFFERERTSFHEKDGSYPKDLDRLKKLIGNEYHADPMNQRIERNMGEIRDFSRLEEHLHRDMEQKLTGKHGGFQTEGGTNYRELLLRLKPGQTEAGSYVGGHWSEYPNTMAHVRMQDRVGPNGEKILHVEEVQSDWHKDGLETAQGKAQGRLAAKGIYRGDEGFKELLRKETILSEGYRREYVPEMARIGGGDTVPDAPFKRTWHDVALKRVLREAAEGGYDKLSINSGRAVGALEMGGKQSGLDTFYDKVYPNSLNKITKKHGVRVQKDGLKLAEYGRRRLSADSTMDFDDLEMSIAEVTEEIEATRPRSRVPLTEDHLASLEDGEEVIIKQTGQLVRVSDYDMGMPGDETGSVMVNLNGDDVVFDIKELEILEIDVVTPEPIVRADSVTGELVYSTVPTDPGPAHRRLKELEAELEELQGMLVTDHITAHTVDMTPELRKSLLEEGQPLFQGKKGAVQFAKDGRATIYAFQNSADLSTLVHETAHVFRRSLGEVDPKILAKAEAALGVATGARWSREAEESFAEQFESYMMEGKTKNKTLRPAFEAYSEWLKSIYSDVATTNPEAVSPEMKVVFGQMLGKKDPLKKISALRDMAAKARILAAEGFDHATKGSKTEQVQEGSRLHTEIENLIKREAHEQILPALNEMKTLADKSGEKVSDFADRMGKVFSDALEEIPGGKARLEKDAPELVEHVERIKTYQTKLLERGKDAGIRVGELMDTMAKFRHRQMSDQVKHYLETHTIGGTASSRQAGPSAVSSPEHQGIRHQLYKDSPTTSIDEALSDLDVHDDLDDLHELKQSGKLDPDSAEFAGVKLDIIAKLRKNHEFKEINGKKVRNVSAEMKGETDGKFRMLNKEGREALLSSSEIEVRGGKVFSKVKRQGSEKGTMIKVGEELTHDMDDRFEALVDHMMEMPVYRDTGGLFGNVFTDMESGFIAAAHSIGAAESTTKILSEGLQNGALLARAGVRGKEITLGGLLDHPAFKKLDPEQIYGRLAANNMDLVKSITKKIKEGGKGKLKEGEGLREFNDQLANLRMPKEIMDDFVRAWEFINSSPDATGFSASVSNAFRSMTALFKAGVLTHPGRYMRDFTSGQIANMYNKMFSPSAFMSAKNALFNKPDKNLLRIKEVTDYMKQRGLKETAENATLAVREMYAARRGHASSAYRDLDSPSTVLDAGNDLESMMDVFPGGTSGMKDLAKEMMATALGRRRKEGASLGSAYNLANVAGVNGRRTTELGVVKAGNIVGKHADDMNRLVGFIHLMKKGDTADDAMKMVDRVQLNYAPRTFTPTEQMLKKVFPFYSFMSRQLAYVGSELMHNPAGILGGLIRIGRHQQDEDEFLPGGVKGTMAVGIGAGSDPFSQALAWGRSKENPEGTENYLAGMGLMFEESLNLLAPESLSEGLRTVGKSLNPMIKGPIEWATGVSLFQGGAMGGKPLHDMDPVMGRILSQLGLQGSDPDTQAKPIFGSRLAEFAASNSPMSRILSTARTTLDDRKGYLERAMNVLSGMRIQSVSPHQRRRGLRDLTDAIARDHGGRAFSNMTISKDLLESVEGTPEHTTLTAIKELRKLWDRKRKAEQRAKGAQAN